MLLLKQNGYSTAGLRNEHLSLAKAVGLKADWPGSVEVWVETMTNVQATDLIEYLQGQTHREAV